MDAATAQQQQPLIAAASEDDAGAASVQRGSCSMAMPGTYRLPLSAPAEMVAAAGLLRSAGSGGRLPGSAADARAVVHKIEVGAAAH